MRISDWSSDVCSSDLQLRQKIVTFCQRKQDRNVKARPRTPVERRRSCGNGRWPGRNPAGLDDDPSVALYNISAAAPAPLQRIHTMTATPPAEAETRGSEAYEALKQALISGHFMPGQKLTLRMLAEALGMSVTPVREAIHRLPAERDRTSVVEGKSGTVRVDLGGG